MRILLACPYAWDTAGGVQTHVRQLAATLAARGHAAVVLAPARTLTESTGDVQLVGRTADVPWGGSTAPLCCSFRSFRRIRAFMRAWRPDVVHVHEPFVPSTGMLAGLASRRPVVVTFHAFSERSRCMETGRPLIRILGAPRIAAALAVSEAAARYARSGYAGPIAIVPNGVGIERFAAAEPPARNSPARRTVLWVHRLEPRKGFPTALRAFARVAAELDDLRLVVVGDGPDRDALALVPERLRRRIVMLGAVPDETLPHHHAAADVFVATATSHESFGIALVEAMAAGLPVVASDIDGYREIVRPGVEGLLVAPHDPVALAVALRTVLTRPELAARLGRAGRARARRYAWDVVAPTLEAVYERAVSVGRAVAAGTPTMPSPATARRRSRDRRSSVGAAATG